MGRREDFVICIEAAHLLKCESDFCQDGTHVEWACNHGGNCPCSPSESECGLCKGTGRRQCEADGCEARASEVRQEMEDGVLTSYVLCAADAELWDFAAAATHAAARRQLALIR